MSQYGLHSAKTLGKLIFQMAMRLRYEYNKVVLIMSCITRGPGYDGHEDRFTWVMDRFNDYLANHCERIHGMHFYFVMGYCEDGNGNRVDVSQFTKDNIHPYMPKYRAKMRAALAFGSRLYLEGRRVGFGRLSTGSIW